MESQSEHKFGFDPREMEFIPLMYLCCRVTVDCDYSSKTYIDGIKKTLCRRCPEVRALFSEIVSHPDIERLQFAFGVIRVTARASADVEKLRKEVVEIIKRYPDQKSW